MTLAEQAREFLISRAQAYRLVFDPSGHESRKVLVDLARFCKANQPTFHPDPRVAALQEGRREVWLRIQQHLQLTDDEIWSLFGRN